MHRFLVTFCLLFFFVNAPSYGQRPDSLKSAVDTFKPTSSPPQKKAAYLNILQNNSWMNLKGRSASAIEARRSVPSKDLLFYVLAGTLFLFAILKMVYSRYFSNLVRVFFNTSLRQGQLTDQLLLARLPSLFFNLFFVVIGGWYLYLLLNYFQKITYNNRHVAFLCISFIMLIYATKYCTLKFTGWVTGYVKEADTYLFIVFLLNKIIAVWLIPVAIILSFSPPPLVRFSVICSFIFLAFMLLMRFFRSYDLLQNRISLNRFYFFLYIIGIEVLPLLLVYKGALLILAKYL